MHLWCTMYIIESKNHPGLIAFTNFYRSSNCAWLELSRLETNLSVCQHFAGWKQNGPDFVQIRQYPMPHQMYEWGVQQSELLYTTQWSADCHQNSGRGKRKREREHYLMGFPLFCLFHRDFRRVCPISIKFGNDAWRNLRNFWSLDFGLYRA